MPTPPTGRKPGRPKGSFTTNGSDMVLFSSLHRGQARIYRWLQRALQIKIRAARRDPDWVMPEDMRAELAEIDNFLAKASSAMSKIHETAKKITEDLPTDRLEAQLRQEFIAAAKTFTETEWAVLMDVYKQRGKVAA